MAQSTMLNISAGKNNYIGITHSVCLTFFPQCLLVGDYYILGLQFTIN